jgi:hypothetical protein
MNRCFPKLSITALQQLTAMSCGVQNENDTCFTGAAMDPCHITLQLLPSVSLFVLNRCVCGPMPYGFRTGYCTPLIWTFDYS